ncbi:hypothetical protein LCGC14_0666530 [marine sediment metagenome]|uniref:Uncharacterized protein n=1 Tax=marine sediment metagenome TaxID=412755 RepID=A0A0F9RC94_9ZZZZ
MNFILGTMGTKIIKCLLWGVIEILKKKCAIHTWNIKNLKIKENLNLKHNPKLLPEDLTFLEKNQNQA